MKGTPQRQEAEDYASLRIEWWRAFQLRWNARRDRRHGLPALGNDGQLPAPTPVIRELEHNRDEVIEYERGRFLDATTRLCVRLRIMQERLRQAEARATPDADGRLELRRGELRNACAALSEQIDRRAAAARNRALRFDEYTRRCIERYARTLVRRNPDGAALVARGWPALGALPAWVDAVDPATALLSPAAVAAGAPGLTHGATR